MGLLKTLFRPNSEKYEQRGDDCVRASDWGMAKLAYEAALDALEKGAPGDAESKVRIHEKLNGSMEALSREHVQTAEELRHVQSAGINRHRVGDERALHEWTLVSKGSLRGFHRIWLVLANLRYLPTQRDSALSRRLTDYRFFWAWLFITEPQPITLYQF